MAKCLHQGKEPHILLKLDMLKAFDSVSWPFLIDVLKHVGFGQHWCNLTCLLLSTSSSQFLVNGGLVEHIFHRRGLHQSDPLSSILFILVMDVLNSCELGCSCGFANQLLCSELNTWSLSIIRQLLDIFGHASGLVTNMSKSSLHQFSVRMEIWRSYPAVYLVILSTSLAPIWLNSAKNKPTKAASTLLLIRLLTISLDGKHHSWIVLGRFVVTMSCTFCHSYLSHYYVGPSQMGYQGHW